jgi:hypothetical protein
MLRSFVLRHPGTCTGMFWRPNPDNAKEKQVGGTDWPRNGAVLTGLVHSLKKDNMDWLQVTSWKQSGSEDVVKAEGLWMPFEQGGLLLHEIEN